MSRALCSSVAIGAIPAHALYFTVYDKAKHYLTGGRLGHNKTWAYGVSGVAATLVHDAVMNPAEGSIFIQIICININCRTLTVIKQRMQMCHSPYNGCVECARCVYKREGWCAFYRSYSTQVILVDQYKIFLNLCKILMISSCS